MPVWSRPSRPIHSFHNIAKRLGVVERGISALEVLKGVCLCDDGRTKRAGWAARPDFSAVGRTGPF